MCVVETQRQGNLSDPLPTGYHEKPWMFDSEHLSQSISLLLKTYILKRTSNKKVSKLQSISKYTIASGENLYSFFIIECLSNNVQVLLDSNYKKKIVFFKKQFIKINYGSLNNFKKLRKIR